LLFEIFLQKLSNNFPGIEANFKTGIQKVVQLIQAKKSICFKLNIKTFQKIREKNLKKKFAKSKMWHQENLQKKSQQEKQKHLCVFLVHAKKNKKKLHTHSK